MADITEDVTVSGAQSFSVALTTKYELRSVGCNLPYLKINKV